MKKYVVIALVVLVGGALLIYPLLPKEEVIDHREDEPTPAVFAFEQNLATVGEEVVPLQINVSEEISKLELIYDDSLIYSWDNVKENVSHEFSAGVFGIGTRELRLLSKMKDGSEFVDNRFVRVLSDIVPEKLKTKMVNVYPHNTASFTQGLEFLNGQLYEGTGDPGDRGATLVAEVDLKTGNHGKTMGLPVGYFGEGITILNNTLYQLTYKNGKCYTYDVTNGLQLKGEYNYQGEGWGLCNDGEFLIMSNGTERIVYRNPNDFTTIRTLEVYNNEGPVINLNELEYIDGKIYANVWTTNAVVVIDPSTGKVLQEIDGTNLVMAGRGGGEVMNGIAHDKNTGKTYMTGKYWEKLFEVEFVPALEM